MTGLIAGQLIVSMLLSLTFLIMYGHPGRYEDREMAWFIAALVWAGVLLDGLLLTAVLGADVLLWVAVAVLAGQDLVVGWRLWLLMKARRALHVPNHHDAGHPYNSPKEATMTIAKAIVGAAIAGLGTLAAALADKSGITALEWVTVATTTLVTLYGVWQIPNQPGR